MKKSISDCASRWTLKQIDYSSRRPQQAKTKNRKLSLQFTQVHQNWTIEDWKYLLGLDFCCGIQMVGSEFGINNMKAWIFPPCINGSSWCWWCNGVRDIFLAHFRCLSTNWASFKCHRLPKYCRWPFLSNVLCYKNHLKLGSWTWKWVHCTQMASTVTRSQSNKTPLGCQYVPKALRNISSTLLNLCHKELRQVLLSTSRSTK